MYMYMILHVSRMCDMEVRYYPDATKAWKRCHSEGPLLSFRPGRDIVPAGYHGRPLAVTVVDNYSHGRPLAVTVVTEDRLRSPLLTITYFSRLILFEKKLFSISRYLAVGTPRCLAVGTPLFPGEAPSR